MDTKGFTLIEVLVVITIATILMTIGGIYFKGQYDKSRIERQTKEMYADLMGARAQALYQKTDRTVTLSAGQYSISPWQEGPGSAGSLQKSLGFPVTSGVTSFSFSGQMGGMASTTLCICVDPPGNPGAVDSILVYPTSIAMGKRNAGGTCAVNQIVVQ